MTKEELAKQIFDECAKDGEPVTVEESLEMAEMELKSKAITRYVQSEKPKKARPPKTVIVSDEKTEIFNDLLAFLTEKYDISVKKQNKLLEINYNGRNFKLDLIETRQKK